eukprot:TRINITY_DN11042_c0_g1_i1.p1 TRINITY_DN11042_c0_g1~~TRINITY_DN11042_c0_g1_i1.p1  ORF type:complete len:424 (+),score=113.60 TRINITY_DN11042_c0_g1_i1:38-1309(+)
MEGETNELEIDSELVMSFYDQYQADDLACKVYGVKSESETSVIELKPALPSPDVSSIQGHTSGSAVWNLPDLLVGLDGIQTRLHGDNDSPPLASQSQANLLTSTIPISLHSAHGQTSLAETADSSRAPQHQFYFDSYRQQTDSLLEGLGILTPPAITSVKTEMGSSPQHQYNMDSPITMDLTPLVNCHNIPQFELNLSPKCEPGLTTNNSSIPVTSFSLSNITNIASVSIANIDLLTKSSPLSLDLIAQHCTLLPPELVALPPHHTLATTHYITQDQDFTENIQEMDPVIQTVNIKEYFQEEDCMSPRPVSDPSLADNPSYKRCHLCVRIFSTKANLSSHIRHVHLGEAKHSRVKSIPCPHCQKMFSRKGHMTEHVRTVHEGKKRIYKEVNCQHCGKTFRRKWGLNIHISSAHADVVSSLLKQ